MNHFLQAALRYRSLGLSPIQLCPHDPDAHRRRCSESHKAKCKPEGFGKVPMGAWAQAQQTIASEQELRAAWTRSPESNVGCVMGAVCGIMGIDVDGSEGMEMLMDLIPHDDPLPKTVSFASGSEHSYRYLFKIPKGHPCPTIPFRDNNTGCEPLKFLGNGSQTVMPPSIHPTTKKAYAWLPGCEIGTIEIAEAPQWVLQLLKDRAELRTGSSTNGALQRANARGTPEGTVINEGGRDTYLSQVAGALRRFGCGQTEIETTLDQINQTRINPPLPKVDIERIAKSMCRYPPEIVPTEKKIAKLALGAEYKPLLIQMDTVTERPLRWLWSKWLPFGALVCVDGDGGVGKSTALIDIAARITRNDVMPDGTRSPSLFGAQNVLMIACEDPLQEVIKPRVTASGADQRRFYYLRNMQNDMDTRQISFPLDTEALERVIKDKTIRFVIIDPVLAFLDTGINSNDDQMVRQVTSRLSAIAEKCLCTIVYVRHLSKGTSDMKASYRGGGSLAWVNAARAGLFVAKNVLRRGWAVFAHSGKANLSPGAKALQYKQIGVPGKEGISRIRWQMTPTDLGADDLAEAQRVSESDREKLESATNLLAKLLLCGEIDQADVRVCVRDESDTDEKSVKRVRKALPILHGENNGGNEIWQLEDEETTQGKARKVHSGGNSAAQSSEDAEEDEAGFPEED